MDLATIDLPFARGWGSTTYGPGRDVSVPVDMARHLVKIGQAEYSHDRARRESATKAVVTGESESGDVSLPFIADLDDVLADITDVDAVREMWARDERVTAGPHYEARLEELGATVRED